jgi:hypothetical protein
LISLLIAAGHDLRGVIEAMNEWGTRWAAPEGDLEDLDPLVAICMLKSRMRVGELPEGRVVLEVEVRGDREGRAWVVSERGSVTICFDPPGFDTDVWIRSDIPTLYGIWRQRCSMAEALRCGRVEVDGRREHVRAFARWFDGRGVEPGG